MFDIGSFPEASILNRSARGILPAIPAAAASAPDKSPKPRPRRTKQKRAALPPASQADPADVADLVISKLIRDDAPTLRFWSGSWWYWSAGRYLEVSADQVRSLVTSKFKSRWSVVRSRHVTDVMEHLRAEVSLSSGISPPAWTKQRNNAWKPADCLATRDSIVHLPSLVEGREPSIIPATPRFFTTVATDFSFEPDAPEPKEWLRFLNELWGEDQQSIDTLQEIFGYLLTGDTRYQKIFALFGPPRSGKGTIARVLRRLVGDGNVAGPTLSGFASNFGWKACSAKPRP